MRARTRMRSSLEHSGTTTTTRYCLTCDADYVVELEYNRATGLTYWECPEGHGEVGEINYE